MEKPVIEKPVAMTPADIVDKKERERPKTEHVIEKIDKKDEKNATPEESDGLDENSDEEDSDAVIFFEEFK